MLGSELMIHSCKSCLLQELNLVATEPFVGKQRYNNYVYAWLDECVRERMRPQQPKE